VLTAVKSNVSTVSHVIPTEDRGIVTAVTALYGDLFVVREKSQQVEVYDAAKFTLRHHIEVPDLGECTSGMTACARNKCLYLSSYDNDSVHRVELSSSNTAKKWAVAEGPRGLSLSIAHNLVVACRANKLQVYTARGSLMRDICLQSGATDLWHAIQLSSGDYVVSQYTSPGVVSVVGVDGIVIHSYGQSETSDVGQMDCPTNLAVTQNDDVLVADGGNNKILSINTSTGRIQELALSADGGIKGPRGLCLDESQGRLYVSELGGQHRLLVFGGVRL